MTITQATKFDTEPRPLSDVVREIQVAVARVDGGWVEAEVLKANYWKGLVFLELSGGEDVKAEGIVYRQRVAGCEGELKGKFAAGQQLALFVDRVQYGKGRLRLVVSRAKEIGEGELLRRRQQLLERLTAEGLVGRSRKPLPGFVRCIGLVCSENSDGYHDVVGSIRERWPAATIICSPATVQGVAAADEMSRAIGTLNLDRRPQLIALARGGGSVTDLQPFDSEELARIVAHSPIPILAALGHTRNRPVCHEVAEWTANVPREVAHILYPKDRGAMAEELARVRRDLLSQNRVESERRSIAEAGAKISRIAERVLSASQSGLHADQQLLHQRSEALLSPALIADMRTELSDAIAAAPDRLGLADEQSRLTSCLREARRRVNRHQAELADAPRLRRHRAAQGLMRAAAGCDELTGQALARGQRTMDRAEQRLKESARLLVARDPVSLGFAAVSRNGKPLGGVGEVQIGDEISIGMRDGRLQATVDALHLEEEV